MSSLPSTSRGSHGERGEDTSPLQAHLRAQLTLVHSAGTKAGGQFPSPY